MFGKKKKEEFSEASGITSEPVVRVKTMPEIFGSAKIPESLKTINGKGFIFEEKSRGTEFGKKKIIIISVAGIFILFISGAVWYYIKDARLAAFERAKNARESASESAEAGVSTKTAETPEAGETEEMAGQETPASAPFGLLSAATSTVPAEESGAAEQSAAKVAFLAAREYTLGADADIDQMSDMEEEVFGTDSHIGDSDRDTYSDGWEIINLYDPLQGPGVKLKDSAAITKYSNSQYKYEVLVPKKFTVQAANQSNPEKVVFTAPSGEYFTLDAFPNPENFSLKAWLGEKYGQEITRITLVPFTTKSGMEGIASSDGLVKYFLGNNIAYVWRYEFGSSPTVNFKQTWEAMSFSFIFEKPASAPRESIDLQKSNESEEQQAQ